MYIRDETLWMSSVPIIIVTIQESLTQSLKMFNLKVYAVLVVVVVVAVIHYLLQSHQHP